MRLASRELTYRGYMASARVAEAVERAREALRSAKKKWWAAIFRHRQITKGGVPVDVLLAEMDTFPWDSIEDLIFNDGQRREKLRYYNSVLDGCGISLSGSVLDLACGPASLGYLHKDVVSVDINPQYIKEARRNNQKGVIADIYSLPFEENSFDHVVAIDPPLIPKVLRRDGTVQFTIDPEAATSLVEGTLKTARKDVVIFSYLMALSPPHPEMVVEKKVLEPPYYVIYQANGGAKFNGDDEVVSIGRKTQAMATA